MHMVWGHNKLTIINLTPLHDEQRNIKYLNKCLKTELPEDLLMTPYIITDGGICAWQKIVCKFEMETHDLQVVRWHHIKNHHSAAAHIVLYCGEK